MVRRLACAGVLLALAGPAAAALSLERGEARAPGSGELLYVEQHLVRRQDGRPVERLVLYRCPDGAAFARKRVDYRGSLQAPEFTMEDARLGYREGLRRDEGPDTVWVREEVGAAERSAPVREQPLVADAGFDEFIRVHWDALLAGRSVPLRFAVPSRLGSYGFQLKRQGETRIAGEDAVQFRLRLGGWLGWLAPHIDVAYGRESRRLLRFEGLSNLREDDGRRQLLARIEFPQPARTAPESAWREFAAEPLAACRVRG